MHELLNKEKRIMDIYWSANEPYLISDILKADPSLNRNTVAKALVSLEKKGYLKEWEMIFSLTSFISPAAITLFMQNNSLMILYVIEH